MLQPGIANLQETSFLNARRVLFTPPGLHVAPEANSLVSLSGTGVDNREG
jgi:hypothetical protein